MHRSLLTRLAAGLALAALLILASSTSATNGYFRHGYGSTSKGLAGAGVALPQDPIAAATNPAGMVWLGKQYYAGMSVFSPQRSYTVKGNPSGFPGTFGLQPGEVDSDSEYFAIPALGANWMIDDKSSYGLSIYGNGGMNTDYPTSTFYGSSPTGVDLSQLFISNTYSRMFGDRHSLGVSVVLVYQIFEAKGFQAFAPFSSDPSSLSNNSHDGSFGYGFKIGYLGKLGAGFSIGLSYQTEMKMDELDDYAGLFAEQGGFDIPSTYAAGIAWEATDALTFAFDYQEILYTDVVSVSNSFLPNLVTARLGDDGGAGFGWQDMSVFKLGVQYESSDTWTWRFGYSHGDQPIPDTEMLFNIISPGIMETHITTGFTRTMTSGRKLHLALMYAPSNSVEGPNPLEVPGFQTIELEMTQWELEVSYSWGF